MKRIGLMVPSTNTTCEADFQRAAPRNVTIHGHRLWMTNEDTDRDSTELMNVEIESAARYLATANVDVIAYGCTTGSFYKGPGWDEEMTQLIERTSCGPGVSTSLSVVEALRSFSAKKISVATPYQSWQNEALSAYLKKLGFEVLNIESEPLAAQAGNQGINDHNPESVVAFASKICSSDADALFCSCTAWRSAEAIDELEHITGKPVVTSNQSTIWATFRRLGITKSVTGFGTLLQDL